MKMEVEYDEFNSIPKSSHTLKSKLELLDPRERVPSLLQHLLTYIVV